MRQLQINQNTSDAVKAASLNEIDPEFVDFGGLYRMFGIRRSHAYVLADRGHIKSVSLRRPGSLKGRRLFDVQSVRDFLARQMKEGAR